MTSYFQAKKKIFSFSTLPTIISKNVLDSAKSLQQTIDHYKIYKNYNIDKTILPNLHNQENAQLALNACAQLFPQHKNKLNWELFKDFTLPEHRFEVFKKLQHLVVINDSKSTNLHSSLSAIKSCDSPILLFLGGISKNEKFVEIKKYQDKIYKIIAFGHSALQIKQELEDTVVVETYSSLNEVFKQKSFDLQKNAPFKTLLFSPGGASFDEFKNYQDRGTFFKEQVNMI